MALICVAGPTAEPVSEAEMRAQCRIDVEDDNVLVGALIRAAREHLEFLARPQLAMMTQTWRYVADQWPASDTVELRPYPLQSVTGVSYTDAEGVTRTLDAAQYVVDAASEPGRLRLRSGAAWPGVALAPVNGLAIEFVAGYGDTGEDVPQTLRQALLLLAAHWYETREPIMTTGAIPKEAPFTVTALFQRWRREVG